ncbi:MAG: hypothetical protein STSR0008_18680 [Ignavibacterium sp.]
MKVMIKIFLFVSLMFLISNCNNSTSPTDNIALTKGTYAGTFSVTFKDYQNSTSTLIQTGTITIAFTDSTYTYFAVVKFSSDSTASESLEDFGSYSLKKDEIVMNDDSWLRLNKNWSNSLYLGNTFGLEYNNTAVKIFQDNSFAKWDLNLVLQN